MVMLMNITNIGNTSVGGVQVTGLGDENQKPLPLAGNGLFEQLSTVLPYLSTNPQIYANSTLLSQAMGRTNSGLQLPSSSPATVASAQTTPAPERSNSYGVVS